jgi:hypothetical protein
MLESFPDPLGKPMQIHEITQKKVAEGIIADKMIGGLTNLAWKAAGTTNPLDQNTTDATPVAGNLRQAAAGEVNKSLLAPLAKEMYNRWAQTVQQLLVKSVDKKTGAPVTSAAQIDQAALEKELYQFVNQLAGFDIGQLKDDGSGQANNLNTELKPQITAAIADTQNPKNGVNVWLPLATSIQRAKSIKNFSPGANNTANNQVATVTFDPSGNVLYNGKPYNANDPSHKMALTLQQRVIKNPQP